MVGLYAGNILAGFYAGKYSDYKRQNELDVSQNLILISLSAKNSADNLEAFLRYASEMRENNNPEDVYSAWNTVPRNNNQILRYSTALKPEQMGELEDEARELEHIFSSIMTSLYSFNESFLSREAFLLFY